MFRENYTLPEVWEVLQRIQTDFCFDLEVATYYTSQRWLAARRVLDIGTGNGYYLDRLAALFPEKTYLGVDVEPASIESARRQVGRQNVTFATGDIYALEGSYDFVILRLLMQHLVQPQEALRKVGEVLRPDGCALIVDALDSVRYFYPEPAAYVDFFRSYKEQQLAAGKDRDVVQKLEELLRSHPTLRQVASTDVIIPSTIPGKMRLFEETYHLVIVMAELTGEMKYDFATAKGAWREWCARPGRYMQVGLRMELLERRSSGPASR